MWILTALLNLNKRPVILTSWHASYYYLIHISIFQYLQTLLCCYTQSDRLYYCNLIIAIDIPQSFSSIFQFNHSHNLWKTFPKIDAHQKVSPGPCLGRNIFGNVLNLLWHFYNSRAHTQDTGHGAAQNVDRFLFLQPTGEFDERQRGPEVWLKAGEKECVGCRG